MRAMFGRGSFRRGAHRWVRLLKFLLLLMPSAVLLFVGDTPALAYVLDGNRWPGSHPRVPFYVSTSLQGHVPYDGTLQDAIQVILNAAGEWNDWHNTYQHSGSDFQFIYAGTTTIASVADDGINTIIFSNTQCPYGSGCAAAIFTHQTNGVLHGFDIVLYAKQATNNATIFWSVKTSPSAWDSDLWTVAVHEFGHALGLAHSNVSSVVMGTNCGPGCSRRLLYIDDIDGILALYGPYTGDGFWSSVSVAAPGATFQLSLDYPRAAGRNFGLFFNTAGSGTTPMLPPDSRILPLASPYENARDHGTIFLNPTCNQGGQCQNMFGTLDANGQATVTVQLPADALTSLGPDLYLAAVTRNTSMPSDYEDISVGVHVQIQAPPPCPNGTCDPGETPCNCPQDCGPPPSSETNCTDGIDNDCDGYADCADPDCASNVLACPNGQIPAVSDWGLVVLALLTMTCGTLVLQNRRRPWFGR